MKNSLRNSLDDIATILVIVCLVFGTIVASFVICFEVQSEATRLVKLGANLLSQQPDWMDFAKNYTGTQLESADIDGYIEQVYLFYPAFSLLAV